MMPKNLKQFIENEVAGGFLLLFVSVLAFVLSNSPLSDGYFSFINFEIFGWTLHHLVNDALMALFFYVVGLEIKKEVFKGALSDPRKSSLAIFGALGGIIIPATIYYLTNSQDALDRQGWAIPMATDIAFAVALLAILGKRVPNELKVFLLALAIVDDLCAIIVIAVFYTKTLSLTYFLAAIIPFLIIYLSTKYRPTHRYFYVTLGVIAWYLIYKSGIHATIAGVILAFLTPFTVRKQNANITTPLSYWLHYLHPFVMFAIMPLFAFFNAGLVLEAISFNEIIQNNVTIGVIAGLVIGKPLGIVLFCYTACLIGISKLPDTIDWKEMIGVGFVAGIGFTMSLFINSLTFANTPLENFAKIGVLIGSILSAVIGYSLLKYLLARPNTQAAA